MSPELDSAFSGLLLAGLTAATGCVAALGIAGVAHIRRLSKKAEQSEELTRKQHELASLEVEEKLRAMRRRAAVDAAAIVEEQSRGGHLSGAVKAELAGEKLKELEPSARDLEGSRLTDLVRLGVSELRHPSTTYLITQSMAPPPEQVTLPKRLPAPAAVPAFTSPATKTSPQRPEAKR